LFTRWGRLVVAIRWPLLAAALVCTALGAIGAKGGFEHLVSGGFGDPASDSERVARRVTAEFGGGNPDLLVLYSSATATVDDPGFRDRLTPALGALRRHPNVAELADYRDDPALVSRDRHATYAVIRLGAPDSVGKAHELAGLRPELTVPGLEVQLGGQAAFDATADEMTKRDVERGE
jgi:RND superfamily putative drug exporter